MPASRLALGIRAHTRVLQVPRVWELRPVHGQTSTQAPASGQHTGGLQMHRWKHQCLLGSNLRLGEYSSVPPLWMMKVVMGAGLPLAPLLTLPQGQLSTPFLVP